MAVLKQQRLGALKSERQVRYQMIKLLERMAQEKESSLSGCYSYHPPRSAETIQTLEHLLFSIAPTMESYLDHSTLESRIKDLNARLLKRRLLKRQRNIRTPSGAQQVISR